MGDLDGIRNFLQIDEHLATSGMPRPDDFAAIAREGYRLVINLAMPTSDNAVPGAARSIDEPPCSGWLR